MPKGRLLFTKAGLLELHGACHDSLGILFANASQLPIELLGKHLPGFGFPTVWEQLTHILKVEENWILDLQNKRRNEQQEEEFQGFKALFEKKSSVQRATQDYLSSLGEVALNRTLVERPKHWVGELRSPAFILLHLVTHAFHHKGQVVAMLRTLGYPTPDTDLQRA